MSPHSYVKPDKTFSILNVHSFVRQTKDSNRWTKLWTKNVTETKSKVNLSPKLRLLIGGTTVLGLSLNSRSFFVRCDAGRLAGKIFCHVTHFFFIHSSFFLCRLQIERDSKQ